MKNAYVNKNRIAPSGYVAVTRPLAEKLWKEGKNVTLCGNDVNSFHVFDGWRLGCTVSSSLEWCYSKTFEDVVNNFLFYLEAELGKYPVFYIKQNDLITKE